MPKEIEIAIPDERNVERLKSDEKSEKSSSDNSIKL
jgi:hypothetical protein